jgi:glutaredoxin/glutathione-dependent peroxiredoxin
LKITSGATIPSVPVKLVTTDGVSDTTSDVVLGSGKVVFFGVPGAFTPTCDTSHLPGFVAGAERIKALGVSRIVCGTVNDHHVTKAWAERSEALGKVDFIADYNGDLAEAIGLVVTIPGLGKRFARFAAILENGIVQDVFVQDTAGVTVSGAPAIILALEGQGASVSA